jgi:hypothetical protein
MSDAGVTMRFSMRPPWRHVTSPGVTSRANPAHVAESVALTTVTEFLGVPPPDLAWFVRIAYTIVDGMDAGLWPEAAAPALAARGELAGLAERWLTGPPRAAACSASWPAGSATRASTTPWRATRSGCCCTPGSSRLAAWRCRAGPSPASSTSAVASSGWRAGRKSGRCTSIPPGRAPRPASSGSACGAAGPAAGPAARSVTRLGS